VTMLADETVALDGLGPLADDDLLSGADGEQPRDTGQDEAEDEAEKVVKPGMVAIAAALTCLGGVWIVTRVFRGAFAAPTVGALGTMIGVGLVYLSYRLGKGGLLQYLVLPVSMLFGAVLATTGEVAGQSLPAAVMDAFRGGGLLQPPIPFDPGWRFLIVVLFAFVGAAATGIAISSARPKLAVAVPAPLVLGAALIQPPGSEIVASGVAMLFVVGGLAVAYGADLASEGVGGAGFETRRLARGVSLMAVALVVLIGIAQSDFLFPATDKNQVIPPQKPPPSPPEQDREMFTVKSTRSGPWRLGVLDVYDDNGFMLPSIDPARMKKVPKNGVVAPARPGAETFTAEFSIKDVKGQTLPAVADAFAIRGIDRKAEYDPRTGGFKLVETSVPRGLTYTVEAPLPADAKALAAAPEPSAEVREFLEMPPAPPGVQALLDAAPTGNRFERLQYVRNELYTKVVAAGAGRPGDIPPAKVDEMLAGGNASPFEINAAEVMLSRWAGIPARIGYGFYGGDPQDGGVLSYRPKHGAAWLESYFEGAGWVPILGTPPRARASLSPEEQRDEPNVVASEELGLSVFVPVRLQTARLVYEIVRYYVFTFGPFLLLLLALLFIYPAGVKALRTMKRRRWALEAGPRPRVAVAYAELRDTLHDLNVGHPTATPLEFLDSAEHDDEHEELAWLVTRALWADLVRDLRIEDVEAAEDIASSVTKRVLQAQSPLNRVLGLASRASLRQPWTTEVPNLWRVRTRRRLVRRAFKRLRGGVGGAGGVGGLRRRFRRRAAAAAVTALAVLFGGACGGAADASAPSRYPDPLLPDQVGSYTLVREESAEAKYQSPGGRALVSEGRVFTVRGGDTIQGSVQIALFKPGVDNQDDRVQEGVQGGLGSTAAFKRVHFGTALLWEMEAPEQLVYLWFPPERNVMELFVMRKKFGDATKVVEAIVRHQRGLTPPEGALK
jgi:hypothetical protein